jgi:hypothetical protein
VSTIVTGSGITSWFTRNDMSRIAWEGFTPADAELTLSEVSRVKWW